MIDGVGLDLRRGGGGKTGNSLFENAGFGSWL